MGRWERGATLGETGRPERGEGDTGGCGEKETLGRQKEERDRERVISNRRETREMVQETGERQERMEDRGSVHVTGETGTGNRRVKGKVQGTGEKGTLGRET